jgi:hypothetical protein
MTLILSKMQALKPLLQCERESDATFKTNQSLPSSAKYHCYPVNKFLWRTSQNAEHITPTCTQGFFSACDTSVHPFKARSSFKRGHLR